MTIWQAALIALFTYAAWISSPWLGGQAISYQGFGKPLVAGLIVGLIMGDVKDGVIIGATINALYVGAVTPGGAMSADINIAGYVGTALALATGVTPEVAVSVAVPLGIIGTFAWQLFATINSFLVHKTDKYAADADLGKLTWMTLGLPQIIAFLIRFVPCFLVLYFGSSLAQGIVAYIPASLIHIFTVVGGMLPAIGMAVLIKMLLPSPFFLGYLVIGYVCVAALKLPVFTVALIGAAIAMISMLGISDKMPKLTESAADGELHADSEQPSEDVRTLTDEDIKKVTRRWLFSNTSAWSYERMQNVGFAWSLAPALKKLYPQKDDLGTALTRHMVFFNTEMTIGTPIVGAVLAMEDQRAHGADVPDDMIDAIKAGLMGPLAALGDSLYGSTLNALLLSFCMGLALTGNALGPIIFIVAWTVLTIGISFWGVKFGYKQGMNIMDSQIFSPEAISQITRVLSILGLIVIGGLTAGFVTVTTPIAWGMGDAATALQGILDGLMPGLLPFIVTGVIWYLHDRKNASVTKLLLGLIVVGIVGAIIGLF